jgi:hypothetical protein
MTVSPCSRPASVCAVSWYGHQRFGHDEHAVLVDFVGVQKAHAEIDVDQRPADAPRNELKPQINRRKRLVQATHARHQPMRRKAGRHRQRDRLDARGARLDFAYRALYAVESFGDLAIENAPVLRQLDAAAHALEKAHSDVVFHAREHAANGGLAHIEFLRGAREVAAARGGFEDEQRIRARQFFA